ncbi:UNVERIFIED_CONTAM: hypothetical protein FKN15_021462 [Acipenser sinensis]
MGPTPPVFEFIFYIHFDVNNISIHSCPLSVSLGGMLSFWELLLVTEGLIFKGDATMA